MEKSILSILIAWALLGGVALGGSYRIPTASWSVTQGPSTISSNSNCVDGDQFYHDGPGVPYDIWFSTSGLPEGTYNVGVRAWRPYTSSTSANLVISEGETEKLNTSISMPASSTPETGANRWFAINGQGYGFRSVGSITVSGGAVSVTLSQTSTYAFAFDEVVIYSPGEGYSSLAAAQAAAVVTDNWQSLNAEVNTALPPFTLNLWGSRNSQSFSHAVSIDASGNLVSSGDLSGVDLEAAIDALREDGSLSDGAGGYITPYWNTTGSQQSVENRILSEDIFALAIQQHIASPGWFDAAAVGVVWNSENGFDVLGDPAGDIAWRMLEAMESDLGSSFSMVGWYSPDSASFVARESWEVDYTANGGGGGGGSQFPPNACGMSVSDVSARFCSGGLQPDDYWLVDGCFIPHVESGGGISGMTKVADINCPGGSEQSDDFQLWVRPSDGWLFWDNQPAGQCEDLACICPLLSQILEEIQETNEKLTGTSIEVPSPVGAVELNANPGRYDLPVIGTTIRQGNTKLMGFNGSYFDVFYTTDLSELSPEFGATLAACASAIRSFLLVPLWIWFISSIVATVWSGG